MIKIVQFILILVVSARRISDLEACLGENRMLSYYWIIYCVISISVYLIF